MAIRGTLLGLIGAAIGSIALAVDFGPPPQKEIEAVIHDMASRWDNDTWETIPNDLWDQNEPMPMYLAEEQAGWLMGWEQVREYFNPKRGFMEASSYQASDIKARLIAPDIAVATWSIYWQMKGRRMAPIGERLRANGIFRKTAKGWKFIHYGEAPKSPSVYIGDLYAEQASEEFKAKVAAKQKAREEKEKASQ
jgi:hypothetical protein